MADSPVSSHLKINFEMLADEAFLKYAHSQGIHSQLKKFRDMLVQIVDLLNDASRKEITHQSVKEWMNDLQHLAYDIEDVLDDVATEAMHLELTKESSGEGPNKVNKIRKLIATFLKKPSPSHRLSPKLESITSQLHHLYKVKNDLGLLAGSGERRIVTNNRRVLQTSLVDVSSIVGRQGEKERLVYELLRDDQSSKENFSIVPIVGMGGIGKTTLAQLLYNDTRVKSHFELMAWYCVSDEFDVFMITKTIFQSVTGRNTDFKDLNLLQMALLEHLKGKRFLLVLDDVWSESYEDWETLVRPFHSGAHGSKIIMTTRKEQLLKKLGFDHLFQLRSLSNEDALSLFAQHALGVDNFDSHPTLREMGESIVEKCDGLPLALRTIGRLMRTKTDEEEWYAVSESELWGFGRDDVVPALRISYSDLSSDLKRLFAYCSLFPKDMLFDVEELVLLWMAEGFLTQSNTMAPERLGHEYFLELLSRSFFQHAPNEESLFVMHDLMNDLATYVAGGYFLRFEKHMQTRKEALAKYRHMSFIREEYVAYQEFEELKTARSLRTLLAVSFSMNQSWGSFYLSSKILVDLLPTLPMLRVLSLSHFEIGEVPDVIGSLKHLSLHKLPKSFLKLEKLRHFDTRDTPLLEKLPMGIGELKSLQILTKIIIEEDNGFAITELKSLKNIHGEISIQGLHNVQSPMQAHEANLSQKRLTKLELKWDNGSQRGTLENEVLNELKPHSDSLKELAIVSYGGTEFSNWVGDPSFYRLVHVTIRDCLRCTSLPPLGQLPSLKKLLIQGMDGVKVIGSELTGTSYVVFPSLEMLRFEDMLGWETWSYASDIVFPCLRELYIKDCPKLIDVSVKTLPSLRVLQIHRCGDGVLRRLVQAASSITKLEILSILGLTYEMWRGVLDHLGAVEEVRIYRCNEIRYLWESKADASKVLVNLQKLYVYNCSALVSLGEKEEEEEDSFGSHFLSSLRILDVLHCNNMKHCCCPNSIESLCIGSCSSATRLSFPSGSKIGGGHELKSLDISLCNKQMEMIINTSMPMLEYVYIYHWENLKSIIQLSNSVHLTHLELYGCPSLESFPDLELSKLTSLKILLIEKCPSMDYAFPQGLWPPNLVSLGIGGLKKPISEWSSQNFPTSLVELTLFGEDVRNFSELSDLLPSSLTRLCIEEFGKLESISTGLQHLTSLQHLDIENCPKIIHLPETVLPSLLSLRIYECPKLKERCNGRDSHYWPRISHIPCIEIEHSD
ncbi:putative virus X resistance protein-like, coiled-coil [Helianthus debilis subsp. tardiflorus]